MNVSSGYPVSSIDGYSSSPPSDELALDFGGDRHAGIAALMLLSASETREAARATRASTESALRAAEQREIDALHAQADAIRDAGFMRGAAEIGAAGLGFAAGSTQSAVASNVCSSGATALRGAAGMMSSAEEASGKRHEAAEVAARGDAGRCARSLADVSDLQEEARTMANRAIELLRSMQGTRAATDQAALFIRA